MEKEDNRYKEAILVPVLGIVMNSTSWKTHNIGEVYTPLTALLKISAKLLEGKIWKGERGPRKMWRKKTDKRLDEGSLNVENSPLFKPWAKRMANRMDALGVNVGGENIIFGRGVGYCPVFWMHFFRQMLLGGFSNWMFLIN